MTTLSSQVSISTRFETMEFSSQEDKSNRVKLKIPCTIKSHNKCIFNCEDECELKYIGNQIRLQVYIKKGIFVHKKSYACVIHFEENLNEFKHEDLESLQPKYDECDLTTTDIEELLNSMRELINKKKNNDFYFEEINDNELKTVTGISRHSFNELLSVLDISMDKPHSLALGVYLNKLRSGDSNQELAVRFEISKSTVKKCLDNVRQSLTNNFVSLRLGFVNLSREVIRQNTSAISKSLFDYNNEQVLTVWDGGYIYLQKSSNNSFQMKTFGFKKRHYLKPMLVVTTNGLIIDAFGPFAASDSDSKIFNDIMSSEVSMYFKENDVFFLDRGFEHSREFLNKKNFVPQIPSSKLTDGVLSCFEANKSRFVTKVRFIIEVTFGTLKTKFKKLSQVWPNNSATTIMNDFRIACAIHNLDHQRIYSDMFDSQTIVLRMRSLMNKQNRYF